MYLKFFIFGGASRIWTASPQAPAKEGQRFVFPAPEAECRVEVLRKVGTVSVALDAGTAKVPRLR